MVRLDSIVVVAAAAAASAFGAGFAVEAVVEELPFGLEHFAVVVASYSAAASIGVVVEESPAASVEVPALAY